MWASRGTNEQKQNNKTKLNRKLFLVFICTMWLVISIVQRFNFWQHNKYKWNTIIESPLKRSSREYHEVCELHFEEYQEMFVCESENYFRDGFWISFGRKNWQVALAWYETIKIVLILFCVQYFKIVIRHVNSSIATRN